MLFINESTVRQLLPMADAVLSMREVFVSLAKGSAQNQPRRRLSLATGAMLHSLAGSHGEYFGTKVYSTHPRHGAHFFFLLFDASTAKPLAMMQANWLGQIRTGAASGLATDLMARKDASVVGVIGSGFQALSQVEAVREVRQIDEVRVWSRRPEKRDAFAQKIGGRAVDTAEQCVLGASIVITATNAKDPVVESAWISDGAHINAMGSNHPQRRELPADLVARASCIALDSREQAKLEAGDLLLPWSEADWQSPRVVELQDLVTTPRERLSDDVTIFKSIGLGVEDVAAGALVYERALANGLGESVPE